MHARITISLVVLATCIVVGAQTASGQETKPPAIAAGALPEELIVDGHLGEPAWAAAPFIDDFTQTDPHAESPPTFRTTVQVLAGPRMLVIGIVCEDRDASGIVTFSVRRDAPLEAEDHVRIVLGPFLDGRSGYVFAVNPGGARYDALVRPGGTSEDPDWDGIWEAATARTPAGWSTEIAIPIHTLGFRRGAREWHFNVQRRLQRSLETSRWASPARQYQVTQMSRAGLLTNLPEFALGTGLTVRPAVTTGGGRPGPDRAVTGEIQPSLDVTQRVGSNLLASGTINTDFAETEVDSRRTNLTRFPLFFPEKRTFFLEGSDIFAFGLGLGEEVLPFFSRRIGLVEGEEVPIIAGGKLNGRIGATNVGALVAGTDAPPGESTRPLMTVARVKQNLWSESSVGALVTSGDPLGRSDSWLAGADFTYATSRFRGSRNLLVGVWALATGRSGLGEDATAHGVAIEYPNDLWDAGFDYKRIGRDFDPSLGFVPRRAVQLISGQLNNRTRPADGPIQELFHQLMPSAALDLSGRWESYRVFFAPINWQFRSGDRFEINANPTGERLVEPFEISPGVVIPAGSYHWRRYRLEGGTAQKRPLFAQLTWWFGGFYTGSLHQVNWTGAWNPMPLLTVEFSGERNIADLAAAGAFTQTLVGTRLRVNVSPDVEIASYTQYDTVTESVGVNTRLRWTFRPAGDLFVVYNHNVRSLLDRWRTESNQLLIKMQYAWRL